MTCPSEIKQHIEQALGGDPRLAVVAVRRLASEDLPWLEERVVRLARADGYSWARLGRLLGRSRQAVRTRFGEIDGTRQPFPFRTMRDDARIMVHWYEAKADARRRTEFDGLSPDDVVAW
ncbi:MAG: hypothetical protein QNJ12_20170 [Ilumatobacter sp.]|uniref:hypothetical protein n=1 Tax=Ilumatobacter sp. TaxID=1967498 RepID=UPI002602DE30|nr:hypothetical protein [Ilumatobacter sp.]MDJ0771117.1 hypothetical protein [Ilumatobacter sp.]